MARPAYVFGAFGVLFCATFGLVVGCSQGDLGGGGGSDAGSTGVTGSAPTSGTGTSSGAGGDTNLTTSGTGTSTSTGSGNCDPGAADLTGCACAPGTAPRACYDGNPAMAGVGACVKGTQECKTVKMNEFMGGLWDPCIGSGKPSPEVCDGKADEDCDGALDNGCGCIDGATQMCSLPSGGTGTQTCAMGQWGLCGCIEGATQGCITAQGDNGSQTCTNMDWSPCVGGTCGGAIVQGQPCQNVGSSIAAPPNNCGCGDYGTKVVSLFCDDTLTWQCFPADDCVPAACKTCLQTNCSQFMSSPVPACQTNLDLATTFLEGCGPDRNAWFSNLNAACPNNDISALNQCKFQFCVFNGTCSFY